MCLVGGRKMTKTILAGLSLCLIFLNLLCLGGSSMGCHDFERDALLKFKNGLYDHACRLRSWDAELDCCNWGGISCDNETGHITKLDLHCPSTTGPFSSNPFSHDTTSPFQYSRAYISASLVSLKHLFYLDLSNNAFGGIPIPEFLGSLTGLRYLNLSFSGFCGQIQNHLANLSALQTLDVSSNVNCLNGGENLQWLANLRSLRQLSMTNVDLSRVDHEWMHLMNGLPSLYELHLRNCWLTSIPQALPFLNFTSLRHLDLHGNHFDSSIPNWIGNISTLVNLDLSQASFRGEVPLFFSEHPHLREIKLYSSALKGNCSQLIAGSWKGIEVVDMSDNQLDGELPISMGNFTSLIELDLSFNEIGGGTPAEMSNLHNLELLGLSRNSFTGGMLLHHLCPIKNLKWLYLSDCKLSGPIPSFLGELSSLQSLWLGNNQLNGSIPQWLKTQKTISALDLSNNFIAQDISLSFWDIIPNLRILILTNNTIVGQLSDPIVTPQYTRKDSGLRILDLSGNHLYGKIPESFGILAGLENLHLNNNHLSGELPMSLKNCTLLKIVDLGENGLSGNIPSWIGESFSALQVLRLRSNMFTGNIPFQLSHLSFLKILDLAQNNLSGSIPQSLESLTAMTDAYGSKSFPRKPRYVYDESLVLSMKGRVYQNKSPFSFVTCLDLSDNSLTGEIPSSVTRLNALTRLNLSGNHLSGKIPENIGDLKILQSLDLSRNKLTNTIPFTLFGLSVLTTVNLSDNNLSGRILFIHQIETFTNPSSYSGNPHLCGPPVLKECPGPESSPHALLNEDGEEDDYDYGDDEKVWFSIGIVTGFAAGFWGFWGILLLKKSWRIAYLLFFDKLGDWLFDAIAINIAKFQKM